MTQDSAPTTPSQSTPTLGGREAAPLCVATLVMAPTMILHPYMEESWPIFRLLVEGSMYPPCFAILLPSSLPLECQRMWHSMVLRSSPPQSMLLCAVLSHRMVVKYFHL